MKIMKTHLIITAALKAYLPLATDLGLFLIPKTGLSTSISCGQTVTNTTTTVSQVDQYAYAGTAGQVLSFALWGPVSCNGGNAINADIYSPAGQLLATVNSSCDKGAALNVVLTNSGTYTIL